FLVKEKKYFTLIAMVLFAMGYFVLIGITFPDAYDRNLRFYMESEWVALSIIISTPLVFWVIKYNKASVLLLIIFCIRIGYIIGSYDFFHTRYKNLELTLYNLQSNKVNKA